MARRRIYSDEERKERKKIYDLKYQNKRYKIDPEYREKKKRYSKITYSRFRLIPNALLEQGNYNLNSLNNNNI